MRRKRLLWRAFRSRHSLETVQNNTREITANDILLFSAVRNEAVRLPFFLDHYRAMGVQHFLFVDNGSDDGTRELLLGQKDVSLWSTNVGYKAARFGMDWMTWLLMRYGHGHWTITADADELLVYPDHDTRLLPELTTWLEDQGMEAMGVMLLDLYPKGPLDSHFYQPGQNPCEVLQWFDATGYWSERRGQHNTVSILGGARSRMFFGEAPHQSPVLSKVPLVKWRRSYAYFSSTHVVLPVQVNQCLDDPRSDRPGGVFLHTKMLPSVVSRAAEDKARGQGYTKVPLHDAYYEALAKAPDMWTTGSTPYQGWQQLVDLKLMFRGNW